jgi:hypothetical protein
MKYAVEMATGGMIYTPGFINRSRQSNVDRGGTHTHTHTHTQQDYLISLLRVKKKLFLCLTN